jgi:hypothetical protein
MYLRAMQENCWLSALGYTGKSCCCVVVATVFSLPVGGWRISTFAPGRVKQKVSFEQNQNLFICDKFFCLRKAFSDQLQPIIVDLSW